MVHHQDLPHLNGNAVLTYTGMETDLLFTQGIDLPGFALFPLLETATGRERLCGYYRALIALGDSAGVTVVLESPTWVANRDRAAALGYSDVQIYDLNQRAIELLVGVRGQTDDHSVLISANIGPREDAYDASHQMSAQEAEDYHNVQMMAWAESKLDFVTGYTIAYPNEAIGIVSAARRYDLPVVISFTVETNGCLVTGASLGAAIAAVDDATQSYASYFMVNCAHPDHFIDQLDDARCLKRLRGVVANASRCSHADLDGADTLDAGDPVAFGTQMAGIARDYPNITVLGGCCGTDMRHLSELVHRIGLRG